MAAKRKAAAMAVTEDDDPVDPSDEFLFTGLGGCQEVGRSCHIIQYKGKTIMLDAGMHTGKEGSDAMPYFDTFDLETIDILLISQYVKMLPFHLPPLARTQEQCLANPYQRQSTVSISSASSTQRADQCDLPLGRGTHCTSSADEQYNPFNHSRFLCLPAMSAPQRLIVELLLSYHSMFFPATATPILTNRTSPVSTSTTSPPSHTSSAKPLSKAASS